MNSKKQERSHTNTEESTESYKNLPGDQGDYYINLIDLYNVFVKRINIFFWVFAIVLLIVSIYAFTLPTTYRVGVQLGQPIDLRQLTFDINYKHIVIGDSEEISEYSVYERVKEKIVSGDLNKDFAEQVALSSDDFIFVDTENPEIALENIYQYIKLANKEVLSEVTSELLAKVNKIILNLEGLIASKREDLEIAQKRKIAELKEAREIALNANIVEPVTAFNKNPLFALGTKYLLVEINVLRQRQNDDPFVPKEIDLAEMQQQLSYSEKALVLEKEEGDSPSRIRELIYKINLLKLEIDSVRKYASQLRLNRIAVLEEAYAMAEFLGIINPFFTDWNTHFSSIEDTAVFHSDYVRPVATNNTIVGLEFLGDYKRGSKMLTAEINMLENRKSHDALSVDILNYQQEKHYLENYINNLDLTNLNGVTVVKNSQRQYVISNDKVDLLFRGISIGLLFALISVLFVIFIKGDLKSNEVI